MATGIYKKAGLDVTIRMGGPQINHPQLLAAGVIDFNMGSNCFSALNYVKNNIPMVCVGAIFQKDPQVLIAHAGQGNDSLAAMKGKPIMISPVARAGYWQFLRVKFGYTDDQIRTYTFNMAPFLADKIGDPAGLPDERAVQDREGGREARRPPARRRAATRPTRRRSRRRGSSSTRSRTSCSAS